ncbi:MAG: phosphate ABC transporter permease PstA [Planctomycetes bacterium]|nr:phosphate ABC transporter permease PstA [Planctomycetota bacterium]
MGNKVEELGGDQTYFRWLKGDVPDLDGYRRGNPTGYASYVLRREFTPGAVEIERLEKGFLCGFIVSVQDNDRPQAERLLASFDRDGPEKVWSVFQDLHDEMRDAYLRRVKIEKHDIGRVNAEMESFKRELMRARYELRASGTAVTALNKLEESYASWARNEPKPDHTTTVEAQTEACEKWRGELPEIFRAWREQTAALKPPAEELAVLDRVAAAQEKRADLQAGPYALLRLEVIKMQHRESAVTYTFRTLDGRAASLPLAQVVRAYQPNDLGWFGKLGVYLGRVHEYLLDDPREANTEGGIFPVIIGTLIMTLLMSIAVVPFGVIAALYLREYAKQGPLVSLVRIAVNNLAGVPSIVFGIFGLGFFCVVMGGTVDSLFYPELLPTPTFGGGGVMWASLTLALLTVPVVIVATEEALIAVPSSQREASLGAGASRWQTIRRVILPQAMPGILTGLILAMARGAGEVAPLMLVGAVKLAPDLPIDGTAPFVHLERKFMHLGFHIYDVGFQSPDVDNTKPLVFTTTLVLLALVAVLNVFAIRVRNKIRKRLKSSHV